MSYELIYEAPYAYIVIGTLCTLHMMLFRVVPITAFLALKKYLFLMCSLETFEVAAR